MKNLSCIILAFAFLSLFANPSAAQPAIAMKKQWGEFGEKPGQFKFPTMIASDKASNVYVVDQHNHRIQKFDQNGNFILMWGRQGTADGEFNYPYGIALDSRGNVYVSDMQNNRIQKFTPGGEFIAAAGKYGKEDGQFKYPYGLAVDKDDVLYVIDAFNHRIQKFSTDLKFLSKWGNQESIGFKLYMPHEMAFGNDGNLIISDRQNHRISVFSKDGVLLKRFGEFGEGANAGISQFSEPHGVAVNEAGEIFICDRYNFRVHKFNANGEGLLQWQTAGMPDDSKHFPLGITAAKNGNIYVVDQYAHCIQVY